MRRALPLLLALAGCGGNVVVDSYDLNEGDEGGGGGSGGGVQASDCTSGDDCSPDVDPCWVGACSIAGHCLRSPDCL